MFDFEKLNVCKKAKEIGREAFALICSDNYIDKVIANQLKRASLSIPLNITERTGR